VATIDRRPVLVVARGPATGESIVRDLRQLEQVAVCVDSCEPAFDMMQIVEFALVVVDVDNPADWAVCRPLVASGCCPVAIVTRFLRRDRYYRSRAFSMGAAAYLCKPCTISHLRELLTRVRSNERDIEIVRGAAYCAS
jgi:DNA-binding response OmpR family regulator